MTETVFQMMAAQDHPFAMSMDATTVKAVRIKDNERAFRGAHTVEVVRLHIRLNMRLHVLDHVAQRPDIRLTRSRPLSYKAGCFTPVIVEYMNFLATGVFIAYRPDQRLGQHVAAAHVAERPVGVVGIAQVEIKLKTCALPRKEINVSFGQGLASRLLRMSDHPFDVPLGSQIAIATITNRRRNDGTRHVFDRGQQANST